MQRVLGKGAAKHGAEQGERAGTVWRGAKEDGGRFGVASGCSVLRRARRV